MRESGCPLTAGIWVSLDTIAVATLVEAVGAARLIRYVRHEQRAERGDPMGPLALSYASIAVSPDVGADSALARSLCSDPVLLRDDGSSCPCEDSISRRMWRKTDGRSVTNVVTIYPDGSYKARCEERSPDAPWYQVS